jgi:hypothetical protein
VGRLWKKGAVSLAAAATAITLLTAPALANEQGIIVKVNGVAVTSASNQIIDGRTYVDLQAFSQVTGIPYTYDEDAKSATMSGKTLAVTVIDGKPAVAVRVLAEATGASGLSWDNATQTASIQFKQNAVVYGDVVSENAGCVLASRFPVGDKIIFRMNAVNPITGQLLEDATLKVHLSTGEVLDMHLGEHPPGVPGAAKFWTAAYKVTEDTPKGVLNYVVTAESAKFSGKFEPFNVMPSLITIVDANASAEAGAAGE